MPKSRHRKQQKVKSKKRTQKRNEELKRLNTLRSEYLHQMIEQMKANQELELDNKNTKIPVDDTVETNAIEIVETDVNDDNVEPSNQLENE